MVNQIEKTNRRLYFLCRIIVRTKSKDIQQMWVLPEKNSKNRKIIHWIFKRSTAVVFPVFSSMVNNTQSMWQSP